MRDHYDYIISGAGLAGLSLAFRLCQTPGFNSRVLLIDKDLKNQNDRTWCFWEKNAGPFERLVSKRWERLYFHSHDYSAPLDISPYQYKMIHGIDFYRHTLSTLQQDPRVSWLKAEIQGLEDRESGALVQTSEGAFTTNWVFNSVLFQLPPLDQYHYLVQHFKGWVVRSPDPVFRSDEATLMDFRIDQKGETRFVYILPLDEHRAMIEATVFSGTVLKDAEYDLIIRDYIRKYVKLDRFEVLHEEFGVIPMTNYPFKTYSGEHIIEVGTSGGQVKPSSGYAFVRIQERVGQLIRAVQNQSLHQLPRYGQSWRYRLYDSILLNVMVNRRFPSRDTFTALFKHNEPQSVLKFLNEKTSYYEDFFILNSCPKAPFLKALGDELIKKLKRL